MTDRFIRTDTRGSSSRPGEPVSTKGRIHLRRLSLLPLQPSCSPAADHTFSSAIWENLLEHPLLAGEVRAIRYCYGDSLPSTHCSAVNQCGLPKPAICREAFPLEQSPHPCSSSRCGTQRKFPPSQPPNSLDPSFTIVLDTVHRAAPLAGAATVCARDGALPFSPAVGERVGLFVGLLDLSHPDSSLRYRLRPTPSQDPVLGLSPSRLSLLPFARVVFRS